MPRPSPDEIAELRTWFAGMVPEYLEVVIRHLSTYDGDDGALTAAFFTRLVERRAAAQFTAALELSGLQQGVARFEAEALFQQRLQRGQQPGARAAQPTVHSVLAAAAVDHVLAFPAQPRAEQIQAIQAVMDQRTGELQSGAADEESISAYARAMVTRGPGETDILGEIAGRLREGGNTRAVSSTTLEIDGNKISIKAKEYKDWAKDINLLKEKLRECRKQAKVDGMLGFE